MSDFKRKCTIFDFISAPAGLADSTCTVPLAGFTGPTSDGKGKWRR